MNKKMESPTCALACELIRRPSITPDDQGCQQLISDRLTACGFTTEQLDSGKVKNLWAVHGKSGPLLCLVGHTDVVPTGPLDQWRYPPFDAKIDNGTLYGRGSADMKGSVAAMVTACERFLAEYPQHKGRLALMLTSDEEGPATEGVRYVIEVLKSRQEQIDWCLIGEPSCEKYFGDTIKIGRRGSLTGYLTVHGIQGHIAYPHKADNPIIKALPALAEMSKTTWDRGNDAFPPTSLQFSSVSSNSGADNVIPGELQACFNFRYSTEVTAEQLQERTESILRRANLNYRLDWHTSGLPFLSDKGPLIKTLMASVEDRTGISPHLSTGGGTSDGRHIAPTGAEIAELGPINESIHKIDERVEIAALDKLTVIYEDTIRGLLS